MAELSPHLEKEIDTLDEELWISKEKLRAIVRRFKQELEEGADECVADSSLHLLIPSRPGKLRSKHTDEYNMDAFPPYGQREGYLPYD